MKVGAQRLDAPKGARWLDRRWRCKMREGQSDVDHSALPAKCAKGRAMSITLPFLQGALESDELRRLASVPQLVKKIASISSFTASSVWLRAMAISLTISVRAVSSMRRSPNDSCLFAFSR